MSIAGSIARPLTRRLARALTGRQAGGSQPPVETTRLAHRRYGPGFNGNGMTLLTGNGTAKGYSNTTLINSSGAAISRAKIAFQGWTLTTTGTLDCANSFAVSGTVQYPVGTDVGTIASTIVPGGGSVLSAEIALSTPIPAGATFGIVLSSTVPNGDKYIYELGFAGLCTIAMSDTIKPHALYAIGDSIVTNNSGVWGTQANSRCPVYCASIGGATAATYGASSAAKFIRQVELAQVLGITRFVSNFGTNDLDVGSAATLQTNLENMKARANASGILFTQATLLPKVGKRAAQSATLTSSGNVITATVPDATLFIPGLFYEIAGASQTEYNGSALCLSSDGATTVTFLFEGSATTPATGSITITVVYYAQQTNWQTGTGAFAFGTGSIRATFNDTVRSGLFDGFIEFADYFEVTRGSGYWKVAGEDAALPTAQAGVTVSSVISTFTRFNSNYNRGNSTTAEGRVIFTSGANIGYTRLGNGNTGGDITVTAAYPNAIQVGDECLVSPGLRMTDDGVHPRVNVGTFGGQAILNRAAADYLTALGV